MMIVSNSNGICWIVSYVTKDLKKKKTSGKAIRKLTGSICEF